jgi:hypothetical protein
MAWPLPQADVDAALAYLRREHRRLTPLVVVYCADTVHNHAVIRVFRTRWGPYLWARPVRSTRSHPEPFVYNDGLMNLAMPDGLALIAGCRCGVSEIERRPVWAATIASTADGRRRGLRAARRADFG